MPWPPRPTALTLPRPSRPAFVPCGNRTRPPAGTLEGVLGAGGTEEPSPVSAEDAGTCLSPRRGEESADPKRIGIWARGCSSTRTAGDGGPAHHEPVERRLGALGQGGLPGGLGSAGVDHAAGSRPRTPGWRSAGAASRGGSTRPAGDGGPAHHERVERRLGALGQGGLPGGLGSAGVDHAAGSRPRTPGWRSAGAASRGGSTRTAGDGGPAHHERFYGWPRPEDGRVTDPPLRKSPYEGLFW